MIKILKFLASFYESTLKIRELRVKFSEKDIEYRDFVIKWNFLL